jgi:hypothetical protein
MSKENKYNPYVSQSPTDGNPNLRAYKKRQWKQSWADKFLTQEGRMNLIRDNRRLLWKISWDDFK